MRKILSLILLSITIVSCVSTKNTIQNIDNSAPEPNLNSEGNFVITEFSTDKKYGYDPDFPINIFFRTTINDSINQKRYLNALAGPNGEKIFYKKVDSCCPFPSLNSTAGAGLLDIFEITWTGQKKPIRLYLNIFEKGAVKVPMGMGLKK